MHTFPKAFPIEFRRDVRRWLRLAELDHGLTRPGSRTGSGGARGRDAVAAADRDEELKELRKRTKRLEQEIEILRRAAAYLSRDLLPHDVPIGQRPAR